MKSIAPLLVVMLAATCQTAPTQKLGPGTPLVEQPEFDVSGMSPGRIVRWQADNGNTQLEYLGPDGEFYKFAFARDASKGQPLSALFRYTRRGEAVGVDFGPVQYTYTPHNCELTVGRCVYREAGSDGLSRTVISKIEVDGEAWTYRLYHTAEAPENLIEEGEFTVDRFGINIDREYIVYKDGLARTRWTRRLD